MKRVVLHAGMSKTATSTLQRSLFQNHSDIFFVGKFLDNRQPKGCLNNDIYNCLKPIFWNLSSSYDPQVQRHAFSNIVAPLLNGKSVAIASWEALIVLPNPKFKTLIERWGNSCQNASLLVSIRNPLSWVGSAYLQALQGQYLKGGRREFGTHIYLDFDQWISKKVKIAKGMDRWLSYARNIETAADILGHSNVCAVAFEQLRSEPDIYYRTISEFLNIDYSESIALVNEKHFNRRLQRKHIEHIKSIDRSLYKRIKWLFTSRSARSNSANINSRSQLDNKNPPAGVEIGKKWVSEISNATRSGNNYLADQFGLNLKEYDYPL